MTLQRRVSGRRLAATESGVAAIEFALVFPVLLLLFFGMVNLTHYAYTLRKITTAAELMADLVARQQTTIDASTIDDYFVAIELALRPMDMAKVQDDIGIDVYDYGMIGGAAQVRWAKFYQGSARCADPMINSSSKIGALLTDSDVVVAVVCMDYTAPAANYPGLQFLANRRIEKSFMLRPRETKTLDCTPIGCP